VNVLPINGKTEFWEQHTKTINLAITNRTQSGKSKVTFLDVAANIIKINIPISGVPQFPGNHLFCRNHSFVGWVETVSILAEKTVK
jgi:hypothetical protein